MGETDNLLAAGHTGGEWEIEDDGTGVYIRAGGHIIAEILRPVYRGYPGAPEQDANARLIAGSPAMLAALIGIRRRLFNDRYVPDIELKAAWRAVDSAIAGATGRDA